MGGQSGGQKMPQWGFQQGGGAVPEPLTPLQGGPAYTNPTGTAPLSGAPLPAYTNPTGTAPMVRPPLPAYTNPTGTAPLTTAPQRAPQSPNLPADAFGGWGWTSPFANFRMPNFGSYGNFGSFF